MSVCLFVWPASWLSALRPPCSSPNKPSVLCLRQSAFSVRPFAPACRPKSFATLISHRRRPDAAPEASAAFALTPWAGGAAARLAGSPLCALLEGKPRIAIVGNGPVSNEQRAAIATHDLIVRFNELNSR
jgi:hypothetical protein